MSIKGQSLLDKVVHFEAQQVNTLEALESLAKQSNIKLSFNPQDLDSTEFRDYVFKGIALGLALEQILEGQDLQFQLLADQIVIYRSKTFTLSGFIIDSLSGERLVNATLYDEVQKIGITTNEYGYFSIKLLRQNYRLRTGYVGYKERRLNQVKPTQLKEVKILMQRDAMLDEIEVSAKPKQSHAALNTLGSYEITEEFLAISPNLGGNDDHIRGAQVLAGVNGGIDGLGGLQIRGGEAGQNMMLLDGVTIFLPYHLLGAFSVYNPNMVKSAKLVNSGFPARYGGRVSSIFDVRTREGNQNEWEAQVDFNLINASSLVEGPIQKGKGALLLAVRYSPTGALFNPLFRNTIFQSDEINLNSGFYDFNLKLNLQLSPKDQLYLSFFNGADQVGNSFNEITEEESFDSETNFNWSNSIGSLRWNHIFNKKLFANSTLTFSNYGFELNAFELSELDDGEIDFFYLYTNSARNTELGLSSDFDYFLNNSSRLRFGFGSIRSLFNVELSYVDDEDFDFSDLESIDPDVLGNYESPLQQLAWQNHLYGEFIHKHPKWETNLGLRLSHFYSEGAQYLYPEPRLKITYNSNSNSQLHFSTSRMVQYIHLISSTALRLPSDLWLPSSETILPQDAWQTELGLSYNWAKKISISSSIYLRGVANMYAYTDSASFLEDVEDDQDYSFLTVGAARGAGWETSLNYKDQNKGLLASYTLARAERQFLEHNLGRAYPYEFDQRHQIKLFGYWRNQAWDFSFNFMYFSPNPRISFLSPEAGEIIRVELNPIGQKNSLRSEPYHRLDLSIAYNFQFQSSKHRIKLGAYNVYNRENVAFFEAENQGGILRTSPIGSLGFLPSLQYSLTF